MYVLNLLLVVPSDRLVTAPPLGLASHPSIPHRHSFCFGAKGRSRMSVVIIEELILVFLAVLELALARAIGVLIVSLSHWRVHGSVVL